MSVTNHYVALDWQRLESVPPDDDLPSFLFDAMDDDASWLAPVAFGDQIDHYYFESWNGLMEFNDWFRQARKGMDPSCVKEFSALFMDIGLLHRDDTFAPDPIKKAAGDPDGWLLAAIPPADVTGLAARADAMDLATVAREFQAAADKAPCDMVPDGATVAGWVASLRDGLRATANQGQGIILGAA